MRQIFWSGQHGCGSCSDYLQQIPRVRTELGSCDVKNRAFLMGTTLSWTPATIKAGTLAMDPTNSAAVETGNTVAAEVAL